MPNRILKESICRSPNLDKLAAEEERFFYRLLVQCDDFGRFDGRPAIIKGACFPLKQRITPKAIDRMLAAIRDAGLIFVYTVGGMPYIQVAKWLDHQTPRAKNSKYPDPNGDALDLISSEIIREQPLSLASECSRIRIRESDSILDTRFNEFWELYPRKAGKKKAREAFAKVVKDEAVFSALMAGLREHIGCAQWTKDGGQYIPHPTTWLNQERWEDEVSPAKYSGSRNVARGRDPSEYENVIRR